MVVKTALKAVEKEPVGSVFFCDETEINVAKTLVALEKDGFQVAYYRNATDGLRYIEDTIIDGAPPRLFVIDMALQTGSDERNFPDDDLDRGQTTGITLIRKIFEKTVNSFPEEYIGVLRNRVILYTRVQQEDYVRKGRQFCHDEGIKFFSKRINDDGEFLNLIFRMLEQKDG